MPSAVEGVRVGERQAGRQPSAPTVRRRPWSTGLRQVGGGVASLWLLAVVLLVWEVAGRAVGSVFWPPFSDVMRNVSTMWLGSDGSRLFLSDLFWDEAVTSLSRFARGWGLAVVVGILVGIMLGRNRVADRMYSPIVRFFAAIPNTVLLPIAVQVFGIADGMNVFLIFIGSVWVVMINTADGVAGVDPMWLRSAESLRMSRFARYRRVIVPAASPQIMAGLRVSLGIGLILMVISEMYATTAGLGHQIVVAQSSFRYLDMWSSFVLIGLIGIVLNLLFSLAERRILHWQRRTRSGGH